MYACMCVFAYIPFFEETPGARADSFIFNSMLPDLAGRFSPGSKTETRLGLLYIYIYIYIYLDSN